ncbi:SDR family NAD(P)-dependent oxidoreductase [Nonomuraea sp. NPDC050394]|uniref:SDR family NAD(P)-dependent oxidoreductase n=1 Tax=Nonomuraea sp. NPDC050394 TaxID=3364363 RepID=UPI0037A679CB
MTKLSGKAAIVTGSSKGIGRAIALRLAKDGADVAVNYLGDDQAAQHTLEAIHATGVKAIAVKADVSTGAGVTELFERALAAFGRIDLVVANAGIEKVNIPVIDVTEEDLDQLLRVNTKGPFLVMQAAARHLADGGRIINISSSSTVRPQPGLGLYGTSKSAPNYLAEVLALELGPRRITVNSLQPGPVDGAGIFTDVDDAEPYKKALRDSVPLGRLATPADVADVTAFLAGEESFFITGQRILMNGASSN